MAVRQPLLPPRHLLILFAGVTLILALALVWLGWLLLRQDRALGAQHARERLESAANRIAAALVQRLTKTEESLAHALTLAPSARDDTLTRWARQLGDEAVLVEFAPDTVRTFPPTRLLYYPTAAPWNADASAFATGERLEFREQNLVAAERNYRALVTSPDPAVRAEALLRLGRVLRKRGLPTEALETYDRLRDLDPEDAAGIPAALAGALASLAILDGLHRDTAAQRLADSLVTRLEQGDWRLTRGSFEYYSDDMRRRARGATSVIAAGVATRLSLSRAVDSLWQEWNSTQKTDAAVQRVIKADSTVSFVVTTAVRRSVALVATARHLESSWLAEASAMSDGSALWIALLDANGTPITSPMPNSARPRVALTATESRLPWTLAVASRDPASLTADLAGRRRILLAGLLIASLLAIVGTYVVVRAVGRELDVARVQSDFVAAVSHEFRTPLTSLRQLTELLASGRVPTEERRRSYFDVLRRETERLQRVVEGLLDFGRMEAGTHEYRLESLDASSLAQTVVAEFQVEAAHAETPLEVQATTPGCRVRADREALARALWNLLDNATKYAPKGEPVSVAVTRRNGTVAISVRDRGPGIPPSEQRAVFDKFVRGSAARASGAKGTGLGLAMVRQIVRAHGGSVRVESIPGQGSTFSLELPAEAEP